MASSRVGSYGIQRTDRGRGMEGRHAHEDETEYRACARKRRYATSVEAKKAAAYGSKRKDAPKLYVYGCPYCGGWHLTHRKPRG